MFLSQKTASVFHMKLLFALLFLTTATGQLLAQDIELPAPQKSGGMPLMEALAKRSTARAFDTRELSSQQLSNLAWAGFGINRPDGKRTAPSASNVREIELYLLLKQGVYTYDAAKNILHQIAAEDVRKLGGNADAPVTVLFVADLAKRTESGEGPKNVAAIDSGFISENIYLYCASEGLVTGYRGGFKRDDLGSKLKLRPEQAIIAAQTVGFPKN